MSVDMVHKEERMIISLLQIIMAAWPKIVRKLECFAYILIFFLAV